MVTKERAKQEVVLSAGEDDIFEDCPHCLGKLEHRWQQASYDDFNPVRWCHSCDIAWIWKGE